MDTSRLSELRRDHVDWRYKGFVPGSQPIPVEDLADQSLNVQRGDLFLPVVVIKEQALRHNIRVMTDYCLKHGVSLAPHGKTSMAPDLFHRQLQAGAWAITAANTSQVAVYRAFGIERILLASQLVDERAITWVSQELDAHESFEFMSLVDSVAGVGFMERVLDKCRAGRPIRVLLEVGQWGGRTGCRTLEQVRDVAHAVDKSSFLELAGIEGFEGLIAGDGLDDTIQKVDAFLEKMGEAAALLDGERIFGHLDEVILSAGGSAFFDRVIKALHDIRISLPTRLVLRSGCYITHDSKMFEDVSPLASRADGRFARLQPALELWATVWSRPEEELAILGFGKRDAPFDYGFPLPQRSHSPSGEERYLDDRFLITNVNDQHAYLTLPANDPLAVGDVVISGISHPCTAFDKWRLLPLVNDQYDVIGAVHTFF